MTKPHDFDNDDEVHPPVGSERFVPTCSLEFHAPPARPYLTTSASGTHDNSEMIGTSNVGNASFASRGRSRAAQPPMRTSTPSRLSAYTPRTIGLLLESWCGEALLRIGR